MSNERAKKGGEQGVNGEWYDGGQFLPTSKTTVKGAHKSDKPAGYSPKLRKQEVEPYVWQVPPSEDHRSLFQQLGGYAVPVWGKNEKGWDVVVGFKVPSETVCVRFFGSIERVKDMVGRFNDGERWEVR